MDLGGSLRRLRRSWIKYSSVGRTRIRRGGDRLRRLSGRYSTGDEITVCAGRVATGGFPAGTKLTPMTTACADQRRTRAAGATPMAEARNALSPDDRHRWDGSFSRNGIGWRAKA